MRHILIIAICLFFTLHQIPSYWVMSPLEAASNTHRYVFRIKTKSGNTIGNISITAKDVEAAKVKLFKRYPGSTILNVKS